MKKTIYQIKQLTILLSLFIITQVTSQEIKQPANEKTYTQYMDSVISTLKIEKRQFIKNDILYDRIFPIAHLHAFNDSINISNYNLFFQAWQELYGASYSKNFKDFITIQRIAKTFENNGEIQVGFINVDFSIIDSLALDNNNPKLNIINGKLKAKPNINPFKTKHIFMASVLNSEKIIGNDITFGFGKVFLQKSDKTIKRIELNFENNQNFIIIDNGNMLLNNINVNFQTSGVKIMTVNVTYNDNTRQHTTSTFYVLANTNKNQLSQNIQYITATKPFRGYNEPQDCYGTCYGKGEYKVFLGNGNSHLTKPFIIVDGFDPNDKRKIDNLQAGNDDDENIYKMMNYGNGENLANKLRELGYDVIILNFPTYIIGTDTMVLDDYETGGNGNITVTSNIYRSGGTDYIERNAKVLEALIDVINNEL